MRRVGASVLSCLAVSDLSAFSVFAVVGDGGSPSRLPFIGSSDMNWGAGHDRHQPVHGRTVSDIPDTEPPMSAADTAMAAPASLLAQVANRVRARLTDRAVPAKVRLQLFWATAKAARDFAATDVLREDLLDLAHSTRLHHDLGRHADEDLTHVIAWALRGWNPFETGPLK
jgi:hypothetical protein